MVNIIKYFKIPIAVSLVISAVILFETCNVLYDDYFYFKETKNEAGVFSGLDGFRMKIKNEISQRSNNDFDVLVFGDSYYITGIIPEEFEKYSSLKMFNFSSFGGHGVFTAYCLLDNYLKFNKKKPKIIILGYHPDTLTGRPVNPSILYDLKGGNFLKISNEFGYLKSLKFLIPSMKHQYFFRKLNDRESFRKLIKSDEINRFRHQVENDKGYYALYPTRALAAEVGEEEYNLDYKFLVPKSAHRNIERMMKLARNNNITLIYLFPTYSKDWYSLYRKHGLINDYLQYLKSITERYPNIKIVNYQNSISHLGLYSDRIHLNILGAKKLTKMLALQLENM